MACGETRYRAVIISESYLYGIELVTQCCSFALDQVATIYDLSVNLLQPSAFDSVIASPMKLVGN